MLKTVGNPSTRNGDQTILNGNLVIGTSGKGIDFSANPNAGGATSELLDDYEEGLFTPTLIGTSTAGTGTYSTQTGYYTKVGDLVAFSLALTWTAHTGTGDMQIQGLPFTTFANNAGGATIFSSNIASTAGTYLQCVLSASTTDVRPRQVATGGGAAAGITMDTDGAFLISGHYRAA